MHLRNLIAFNTTSFARRDVVKIPLGGGGGGAQLKSKVVQTSKDGSIGYALMDCATGGSLAVLTGLYADFPIQLSSTRKVLEIEGKLLSNGQKSCILRILSAAICRFEFVSINLVAFDIYFWFRHFTVGSSIR